MIRTIRRIVPLVLMSLAVLNSRQAGSAPVVFWVSEPVSPGDVVMAYGGIFVACARWKSAGFPTCRRKALGKRPGPIPRFAPSCQCFRHLITRSSSYCRTRSRLDCLLSATAGSLPV